MIIFKPEENPSVLKENNCTDMFYAYENGEAVGVAKMNIDSLYCDVFSVDYPEDKLYVCIGLLRACYNCGANKNAYMGRLSDKRCVKAAQSMNFIFDGESYSNDIPTLLMGSCGI